MTLTLLAEAVVKLADIPVGSADGIHMLADTPNTPVKAINLLTNTSIAFADDFVSSGNRLILPEKFPVSLHLFPIFLPRLYIILMPLPQIFIKPLLNSAQICIVQIKKQYEDVKFYFRNDTICDGRYFKNS